MADGKGVSTLLQKLICFKALFLITRAAGVGDKVVGRITGHSSLRALTRLLKKLAYTQKSNDTKRLHEKIIDYIIVSCMYLEILKLQSKLLR